MPIESHRCKVQKSLQLAFLALCIMHGALHKLPQGFVCSCLECRDLQPVVMGENALKAMPVKIILKRNNFYASSNFYTRDHFVQMH